MTVKELCKHLNDYVKLTISLDDEEYPTDVRDILDARDNVSIMLGQAYVDEIEVEKMNVLYIYAY